MLDIKCFQAIHHLLTPGPISADDDVIIDGPIILKRKNTRLTSAASTEKNKYEKRNPGVNDSIKSTLLVLDSKQSVKEEVQKFGLSQQKEKKLLFHPIMVVVLNEQKNPHKFYAIVEDLLFETQSFLDCINTYMKLFWVVNCEFPKEGARTCKFIQQLFFNLNTDDAELKTIIKDLKFSLENLAE